MRPVCSRCGHVLFYDPKVVAAGLVALEGKLLLVRRATEPGLGLWSLPGGYVDRGEVVEEALVREFREETALEVQVTRLLGLFSEPGHPVILAAYQATIVKGKPQPGLEVSEVGFFPHDRLPPLAFPRDTLVIRTWQELEARD